MMGTREKCPWYVWIFSFLATFVLFAATAVQLGASFVRKKFDFNLWLRFCGELFLDWFLFFMLPAMLLTVLVGTLATELWNWIALPLIYALGVYPAIRMWRWRKAHLTK